MGSQIDRPHVLGNFKRSRAERLAEKNRDTHEDRDGNSYAHAALIRMLPCCICWKTPGGQIHHLKATGMRGAGMKSPDKFGLPMCEECHLQGVERAGSKNELSWFSKRGIEALELCAALWAGTGDLARMLRIQIAHKKRETAQDLCKHCGGAKSARNPTGNCDHLYWPDYLTAEAKVANGIVTAGE